IGSHTVLLLLEAGFNVVVADNLVNSRQAEESLKRVRLLTGCAPEQLVFHKVDLCDAAALNKVLKACPEFHSCIHFAGLKFMIEEILKDFVQSDKGRDWAVECLRYFNPTGAHSSGDIGEDPNGVPNNLMPYVAQVAVGKREFLTVFGDKYETKDGTGVRDYIHVVDLAAGHLKALNFLDKKGLGWFTHNLGTGTGYSVLEMVEAMKKASGKDIPYKVGAPRVGDLACVYADPAKALEDLEWKAEYGLDEMMRDMWAWQSKNPEGFSA
ncbi:unnamed protein product, partial [Hapterophycus canaliculatus]